MERSDAQHVAPDTGGAPIWNHLPPDTPFQLIVTAVEQVNDAILITTPELNPPGPQIVYANPAFTKMTGYTLGEVLGQTPRILQGPQSDRAELDRVRRTLERGDTYAGEIVNYRKDGSSFILRWHIAPVRDMHGTTTHWIAVQRDVTQQKQTEAERDQLYRQAQAALRARDELLTIVAHELRTPLTALLGFTELLRKAGRTNDGLDPTRIERMADTIVKQAQRLTLLIEEMLDLDRIDSGYLVLAHEPVDIAAVAEHVVAEFQALRVPHQPLQIEQPDVPLIATGDEIRIRHVLQQLLHNALVYSPQGGQIRVVLAEEGDHIRVAVEDHGIGIPPAALPHVWERFYRAPNVDSMHISGFGIGLYVVREIVRRHSGSIAAESVEGRGSVFTVRFPRTLV